MIRVFVPGTHGKMSNTVAWVANTSAPQTQMRAGKRRPTAPAEWWGVSQSPTKNNTRGRPRGYHGATVTYALHQLHASHFSRITWRYRPTRGQKVITTTTADNKEAFQQLPYLGMNMRLLPILSKGVTVLLQYRSVEAVFVIFFHRVSHNKQAPLSHELDKPMRRSFAEVLGEQRSPSR